MFETGKTIYIKLANESVIRGTAKFVTTDNYFLDNVVLLDSNQNVGSKSIPKDAIATMFSINSSGEEVVPILDMKNPRDRMKHLVDSMTEIFRDFIDANFGIPEQEQGEMITAMFANSVSSSNNVRKAVMFDGDN